MPDTNDESNSRPSHGKDDDPRTQDEVEVEETQGTPRKRKFRGNDGDRRPMRGNDGDR